MRSAPIRVELWITPTGDCDGYNIVGFDEQEQLKSLLCCPNLPPTDVHRALELASEDYKTLFGFQLSLFPS